jgi:transposase
MINSTKLWEEKAKDFLPNHSIEVLQTLFEAEKIKIAKKRLKVCILRKKGKTLTQISIKLHIAKTTIYNWLNNIIKFGLVRLYNIKNSGKSKLLSKNEIEELDKILQESPKKINYPFKFWTNKLVQVYINEKYNISYKIRNIRYLVKQLGFSLQKARPKNPNSSSKKQKEFIENVKKKFQISLKMDSRSFVLMKSIV